jgi:TonB family protein
MNRGDHSFAICFSASLVLHVALAFMVVREARSQSLRASFQPPRPAPRQPSIYIDDSLDASEHFGLPDGAGRAANARPGDEPMSARHGEQTQAFLSRDPVGPGNVGDDPTMNVLPRRNQPSPAVGASIGAAPSLMSMVTPHGTDDTALLRMKNSPLAKSQAPVQGSAAPSSNAPAADPAIMSDSESDPFSPDMRVALHDGAVEARLGRKVKTVRPKLSLAARVDLMSMDGPRMTVRLMIDPEGAVRKVDIVRSSGSVGTDEAVKVALYEWWVEPKKDELGHAIASVITFPIVWR